MTDILLFILSVLLVAANGIFVLIGLKYIIDSALERERWTYWIKK